MKASGPWSSLNGLRLSFESDLIRFPVKPQMQAVRALTRRVRSKYHRLCGEHLYRRPLMIVADLPVVSFTFDDFPSTALSTGGGILRKYGKVGTYYVSFGLAGKDDATGRMCTLEDLKKLRAEGHELGCHTYDHCDSGLTPSEAFLKSVRANSVALARQFPGASFRTLSFPKSAPRGRTKQLVAGFFECCRGGGQTFNAGTADLNNLRAYFLEQAKGDMDAIRRVIDQNQEAKGWLIFASHDVCYHPSPFGCTPELFDAVVRYTVESGALVLPVLKSLEWYSEHRAALAPCASSSPAL